MTHFPIALICQGVVIPASLGPGLLRTAWEEVPALHVLWLMWAKPVLTPLLSWHLSAILSNVCAWIHGLEMQGEVEERLEAEDFVRILSAELTLPSSFLVTIQSSLLSSSLVSSPPSSSTLLESLLSARGSAGCFMYWNSCSPHIKLMGQGLLWPQIYRSGNWSLEWLNNLLNFTKLGSSRGKVSTQII